MSAAAMIVPRPRPTTAFGPMVVARPLRPSRALRWHVVDDLERLDAMGPAWDALAAGRGLPTAQHAWTAALAHAYHAEGGLHVVAVVRDGRLVAVAPLAETERGGELEPIGMATTYEPVDFLYADDAALDALALAVARLDLPLSIPRLSAESPTLGALAGAYSARGMLARRSAPGSPTLAIDESWTGPEGALSSRRRSDMRRARRRAEALGAVEVALTAPGPEDVGELLAEALAVEASGWKGREGTAVVQDELRTRFTADYAARTAACGALRLGLLRIDGRAVAMQFAVEYDQRLWLLKIGFDDEFSRCSPGSLLLLESLRDAAARGLHACEFLGGIESWTQAWTEQERPVVAVRAFSARPRNLRRLGAELGRRVARGATAAH